MSDDYSDPEDDALRRKAAAERARHLKDGGALVRRCRKLAAATTKDDIAPLHAAARLLNANARTAEALATLARVEKRRRVISEQIQRPDPKILELNSRNEKKPSEIRRDIAEKWARFAEEERQRRLLAPISPQEEANLRASAEDFE